MAYQPLVGKNNDDEEGHPYDLMIKQLEMDVDTLLMDYSKCLNVEAKAFIKELIFQKRASMLELLSLQQPTEEERRIE